MSKSRNMACLYVPWSRENVIVSAAYKQFSSLVERGKMRCENLQRPLGSPRGFSLSPRRFRDLVSPLRGLLLISFAKKNQEKPLGPGYTYLSFSDLLKC